MKGNFIINDNKKPLLDIDNDLIEMSKNLKIITSLKSDIEEIIDKKSNINNFNNNIILQIEDKYNTIKKQIQKFMNKKNYIYNFIRNENPVNSNNNNINNNDIDNEENEKLLNNNKMDNVMEKINIMQNEMKNKIKILDEKILKSELLKKKQPLIEEINSNEINEIKINNENNNNKIKAFTPLSSAKAFKYNEETKELENVVNKIEKLRETTNHIKMIEQGQGNNIDYIKDMNLKIEDNIQGGEDELIKRKREQGKKNKNIIIGISCLSFLLIIFIYIIYNKFFKKK